MLFDGRKDRIENCPRGLRAVLKTVCTVLYRPTKAGKYIDVIELVEFFFYKFVDRAEGELHKLAKNKKQRTRPIFPNTARIS